MMANGGWRRCSKRATLFIIVTVTLVVTLCFYNRLLNPFAVMDIGFGASARTSNNEVIERVDEYDRYSLRTAGCIIERIDPWDPAFKKYFWKLSAPKCPQTSVETLIRQTDEGYLQVDGNAKRRLVAANSKGNPRAYLICQKRAVYRNPVVDSDHTDYSVSNNVTEFIEWTLMDVEYAQIKCMVGDVTVYHNYFYNTVRKPEVEKECGENTKTFLKEHPLCVGHPRLSVLLVGIDSLSKANFLRQMPNTFDIVANNFMGIDMMGYNKVGLNTFPSLIPYLTGNTTEELAQGCWGGGGTNTFDNCTFMWDLFAKAGYRTAFVENMDDFGLFVFNKGGTHRQVAHYYGHTLYIPAIKHSLRSDCWRGIADDTHVINWAFQFQKQFANDPHFGHFWMSRYSHNDLNTAQHLDPLMTDLFKKMHVQGLLNNTLLIFKSDHGIRFGDFRETEVGRQEENLPFMYLMFPRWFRNKYPVAMDRLRENGHRLTTMFDLHETLKQIINCEYASIKSGEVPTKSRGVSLFRPISGNRTCDDAGIPAIYCACRENVVEMDVNSSEALPLAELLVRQLNVYTEHVRSICVKFFLKRILSFKKIVQMPDDPAKKSIAIRNTHIIAILVKPGNAKFEATIQYVYKNSSYIVNDDVRRINRYGDTSYCIYNDGFLKSVCYCGHD